MVHQKSRVDPQKQQSRQKQIKSQQTQKPQAMMIGDGTWEMYQRNACATTSTTGKVPSKNDVKKKKLIKPKKSLKAITVERERCLKLKSGKDTHKLLSGKLKSAKTARPTYRPTVLPNTKEKQINLENSDDFEAFTETDNFFAWIQSAAEDGVKKSLDEYIKSQFKFVNSRIDDVIQKIKKLATNYSDLANIDTKITQYKEEQDQQFHKIMSKLDSFIHQNNTSHRPSELTSTRYQQATDCREIHQSQMRIHSSLVNKIDRLKNEPKRHQEQKKYIVKNKLNKLPKYELIGGNHYPYNDYNDHSTKRYNKAHKTHSSSTLLDTSDECIISTQTKQGDKQPSKVHPLKNVTAANNVSLKQFLNALGGYQLKAKQPSINGRSSVSHNDTSYSQQQSYEEEIEDEEDDEIGSICNNSECTAMHFYNNSSISSPAGDS